MSDVSTNFTTRALDRLTGGATQSRTGLDGFAIQVSQKFLFKNNRLGVNKFLLLSCYFPAMGNILPYLTRQCFSLPHNYIRVTEADTLNFTIARSILAQPM